MKTRVTTAIYFCGFVQIFDEVIESTSIADFEEKKKNWLEEKKG